LVVAFVLLLCGAFLMWRIPLLPEGKQVRDTDSKCSSQVSIIVPMRNEEHSIPTLLKSLQGQLGPVRKLIAVDDGSADNGAALAQQFGAIVVQVPAVPQGWTGKSWACWTGAVQSSGELLLFLDADTFLEPGGLQRILAAYRNKAGLVTVQPFHVTVKAYEQLSAIFNIVSMAGVNAFTLLGDMLRPHGAFGPCMICSREDYFSTGGHAAVRNKVLEDLALAALFSRNGHSVSCYGGRGAINFRMYPQGLFQLSIHPMLDHGLDRGLGHGCFGSVRARRGLAVPFHGCCRGLLAGYLLPVRIGDPLDFEAHWTFSLVGMGIVSASYALLLRHCAVFSV